MGGYVQSTASEIQQYDVVNGRITDLDAPSLKGTWFKMRGILIKTVVVILSIFVVVGIGFYIYLRSFVPDYNAAIKAPGLKDTVVVKRNRYAVPTIIARNDDDLYFVWGYVNAQDRFVQMEITRRISQG